MANNIDYKKYLSELGKVETNQKEVIKKYLEEQCEKDAALKSLYRPEKLNDCYNFIMECARNLKSGNCACIEDSVVFKMARDFFIEVLPKTADEPPEVTSSSSDNLSTKTDSKDESEQKPEQGESSQPDKPEEAAETEFTADEDTGDDKAGEENPAEADNENIFDGDKGTEDALEAGAETSEELSNESDNENPVSMTSGAETELPADDNKAHPAEADNENPEEDPGAETASCLNQDEGGKNEVSDMADKAVSDICKAMNRHEEPVHYDSDGNGLLFDFD